MKELKYLNKYFLKYRYRIILGILITIGSKVFASVYSSTYWKIDFFNFGSDNRIQAAQNFLGMKLV